MNKLNKTNTMVVLLLIVAGSLLSLVPTVQARDFAFADPAFRQVWNRSDAVVTGGPAGTSWLWGPQPLNAGLREPYTAAPGGTRLVQYFDKARMEVTNPASDRNNLFFVTNGLLPIELITGRLQVGDAQFVDRGPARVPAVGDLDNPFPTYADLAKIYSRTGTGEQVGTPVTSLLNRDGAVGRFDTYRDDPATRVAAVEQQHGIPATFLNHMQERSGALGRVFVFGYPVSGAYWVQTKVEGRQQPVLLQVFERRVLTYTPNNVQAFRVESGNVGQHYWQWRYGLWTRQQFPPVWDFAMPQTWRVDFANTDEGAIQVQGPYMGKSYRVDLSYPIGINRALDAWVNEQLAGLTPKERATVRIVDVTVAGVPAKKVLNFPPNVDYPAESAGKPTHRVYIWRRGDKSPSLVRIAEVEAGQFDSMAMEALLDRFVSEVRP